MRFPFFRISSMILIYSCIHSICNGEIKKENPQQWASQKAIKEFGEELGFENMTSFEDIKNAVDETNFGILHSLKHYVKWASLEETIVQILTKRLQLLTEETTLIKRYLENYESSSGNAIKNARETADTPQKRGKIIGKSSVLGHRMIHRYVTELYQLKNLYNSSEFKENENNLKETLFPEKKHRWVSPQDIFLSSNAFIHLQEVLLQHPQELRIGQKRDTLAGGELNSIQCAEIGMFSLYRERYVISVEWLETANFLSQSQPKDNRFPSDLTKFLVRVAAQAHNYAGGVKMLLNPDPYLYMSLYESFITAHQSPLERTSIRKRDHLKNRGFLPNSDLYQSSAQYSDLCMGKTLRPMELEKDLKCYYEKLKHPYFYINPIKTEQLSENPPVLQFYEIIGNQTNTQIQNRFQDLIRLNNVAGSTGPEYVTNFRSSSGVGVTPALMPKEMYSLAELLTGLRILNNSDLTHYVEYTYGKFYTQHGDFYENSESAQEILKEKGDRLATMLYYLELPDAGGQTPFCQGGISAHPVRNSAIFWYNLHRNGTARKDVIHGACPVIHGNKIIMNHWIYHRGNFDKHKCTLDQYE